jgi:hypothetical protein
MLSSRFPAPSPRVPFLWCMARRQHYLAIVRIDDMVERSQAITSESIPPLPFTFSHRPPALSWHSFRRAFHAFVPTYFPAIAKN